MKAEVSAETTGRNPGDRGKRKGGRYRHAVESISFQPGGESVSPADWILVAVLAVLLVLALRFRSRVPIDEYVAYQELLNEEAAAHRKRKKTLRVFLRRKALPSGDA